MRTVIFALLVVMLCAPSPRAAEATDGLKDSIVSMSRNCFELGFTAGRKYREAKEAGDKEMVEKIRAVINRGLCGTDKKFVDGLLKK